MTAARDAAYYEELEAALRDNADVMRFQYGSTARLTYDEAADAIRDLRALVVTP